ncbi:Dynamitin-domain-containing protein [Cokeromyces recurvatus]|uniref:Dynamitin-domain-containing protein n=1 Tax=Cokeromyces recurvatus TaxID=90255 RepID=UPI002220E1A5|nr:Dynamitin-domain-containing protein [Cokeromyces recurvatus]KAI7903360.1 Dynamitin-domain-containing protein [Cokeromyces recurvatus]
MNQQIGDEMEQTSNYGKSIDEAKSLIKQLEAFKNMAIKSDTEENKSSNETEKETKDNLITYELYYTPETVKMQKETKLSDIDERIAKLEKLVGTNTNQNLDELPSSLASTSLISSLSKLEQQIHILAQPRQLEIVARRVKVLNNDLERLNELKTGRKDTTNTLNFGLSSMMNSQNTPAANVENANKDGNDNESKVNKLFATLEKVDPLLNLTPALLTRLKALQSLHTEAASFSQSIKIISEEQTRMTDELKSLSKTCELLNISLKENDESVMNNVKIIDERMTDLIQRITALSPNSGES